ncbi:MAG TPA: hypothetical protein DCO83_02225, partial [Mucilaginibacter sp.]|nr:hypothetical protein [Mucilaginibacter sp.]
DASAIGAVFLAMDALQLPRPVDDQSADRELNIVPNQANHQTYNKAFLIFKRLYNDLKDTMHWVYGESQGH